MAIATVVTRGYGDGTLSGSIPQVVARGYFVPPANVTAAGAPLERTVTIQLESRTVTVPFSSRTVEA